MATPYSVMRLPETDSTQDDARRAYRGKPVVVISDRQREGRGRRDRKWISAPGALAVSVACEPRWDPERWGVLPLMAGWEAAMALGGQVGLKWPNDLLVGEQKVGGILVEARGSVVVAGCGLNLWWPDPPTGMAGLGARPPDSSHKEQIARAWAGSFLKSALDPGGGRFSLRSYRRRCTTLGQRVRWGDGRVATAIDIDRQGALVVEDEEGRTKVTSEEVFHIPTAGGAG